MRLGFIGLGTMGLPMAGRLLAAGHELACASRSPGPVAELARLGAVPAERPADVVARSEITFLCLPDDAAVRSVVESVCRPSWDERWSITPPSGRTPRPHSP